MTLGRFFAGVLRLPEHLRDAYAVPLSTMYTPSQGSPSRQMTLSGGTLIRDADLHTSAIIPAVNGRNKGIEMTLAIDSMDSLRRDSAGPPVREIRARS